PSTLTSASAIGAPEAASVMVPSTLAPCASRLRGTKSSAVSATATLSANLIELSRMIPLPLAKGSNDTCGDDGTSMIRPLPMTGWPGRAGLQGLATTSTRNDDVALEVENAANRNLIHGTSLTREGGQRLRSPLLWRRLRECAREVSGLTVAEPGATLQHGSTFAMDPGGARHRQLQPGA